MSLSRVIRDGECFTLSPPFSGGSVTVIERVGPGDYCATMRAYYGAVAAACGQPGGGVEWCGGYAGVAGGEHKCGSVGCVAAIGSDVGVGASRVGGATETCDNLSGCVSGHGGDSASGGSEDCVDVGQSVDADDVFVSGGFGSDVVAEASGDSEAVRGRNYVKNKRKRVAAKLARLSAKRKGGEQFASPSCGTEFDSVYGSGTSVRTVDTRTGVEIEAAQTLAARRVAENRRAEVEAKVAAALAEHKLRALNDKGRTAVVERLAAARYEQRINEARLRAQKSFSASEDSLKSLGSMGSAGELYAKQAIKKSRDDAKTLKYVQDQAKLLLEHASPEVRQMVAEMPAPVYDDEFEVFGDCPSDFDEEQREAYYADLNRTNFELGQIHVASEGHREATPEELLRIKEELAALSVY